MRADTVREEPQAMFNELLRVRELRRRIDPGQPLSKRGSRRVRQREERWRIAWLKHAKCELFVDR
jgi:hypothetical protein